MMNSHLPTAAGFSPLGDDRAHAPQPRRSPSLSPWLSPSRALTPPLPHPLPRPRLNSRSCPSRLSRPHPCRHPCPHPYLHPIRVPVSVPVPIPVPISLLLGPSLPCTSVSHFQTVSPMAKVALSSGTEQTAENKQTKNAKTDKKHFYFLSMTRLPACLGVTLFQACLLFMFCYIYIN